jgi:hypothetical protein
MTKDDVISWAREAGSMDFGSDSATHVLTVDVLQRMCELAAAAERRKHQADIEAWKAQAATAEKWRGLALAKDPMQPGKVVQEIQREAVEQFAARTSPPKIVVNYTSDIDPELLREMLSKAQAMPLLPMPAPDVAEAVAAEREACAAACDALVDTKEAARIEQRVNDVLQNGDEEDQLQAMRHQLTVSTFNVGIKKCAAAIRARGNP